MEIWENTKAVVQQGLSQNNIDASQLEALGITNQRETTIVWDAETGKPVHNALVWQDRRTTDRVEEIQNEDKTEWILDNAEPMKMDSSRSRVDARAATTDFGLYHAILDSVVDE